MDKIHILYFLEDRAQEGFVQALVERIALGEGLDREDLVHDIRSAGGGSKVITDFEKFIRDYALAVEDVDFLVVAIDGNCKGHTERIKDLEKHIGSDHALKNKVVYAVPDPHIERWYIMDQRAFKKGVGLAKGPEEQPKYKCKKDFYKQVVREALLNGGVSSLLGGVEYAERIVANIDNIDVLGKQDDGFSCFVNGLKKMFGKRIAGV
ncbi:MAG: hypothetical protein V1784_06410 [bacterium]